MSDLRKLHLFKVVNEVKIFLYVHIGIKRGHFGQIAYSALRRLGIFNYIYPVHRDITFRVGKITRYNVHHR